MLRIVKEFPAVRAFGGTRLRPDEFSCSEVIQFPQEATHVSASASVLHATGPVRVRVSLESGGPPHWVSEDLLDLSYVGAARTCWRPIAAGRLRVSLNARLAGQALVGPVDLVPAILEDDGKSAAGENPVSR